jgi:hypothetical protein
MSVADQVRENLAACGVSSGHADLLALTSSLMDYLAQQSGAPAGIKGLRVNLYELYCLDAAEMSDLEHGAPPEVRRAEELAYQIAEGSAEEETLTPTPTGISLGPVFVPPPSFPPAEELPRAIPRTDPREPREAC